MDNILNNIRILYERKDILQKILSATTKKSTTGKLQNFTPAPHVQSNKSNVKKVTSLTTYNNITLILGCHADEPHIQFYQSTHPDETVVGINSNQFDPITYKGNYNDKNTLYFNFNDTNSWKVTDPLQGKVGLIMFDYSTFKFANWNKQHLKIVYELLKEGGKFCFECCNLGGMKYQMNYFDHGETKECDNNDNYKVLEKKIPWLSDQGPLYYDLFTYFYCEKTKRPVIPTGKNIYPETHVMEKVKPLFETMDETEHNELYKKIIEDYLRELERWLQYWVEKENQKFLEDVGFKAVKIGDQNDNGYPLKYSSQDQFNPKYMCATK